MSEGENERAVVVTGASTGIGKAIALALDASGFRVFAGVRKETDGETLGHTPIEFSIIPKSIKVVTGFLPD